MPGRRPSWEGSISACEDLDTKARRCHPAAEGENEKSGNNRNRNGEGQNATESTARETVDQMKETTQRRTASNNSFGR